MHRTALLLMVSAFGLLSCKPATETSIEGAPLSGHQLFLARCVACHQADGRGIPGICPPLATSPRLTEPPENLIRILLLGMKGTIVRNGTSYSGIMPSWRFDLTDGQVALVLNDLYSAWNPRPPVVTEEMVRRIREETVNQKLFPTQKDLKLPD